VVVTEGCPPNIGPAGRARRRIGGIALLTLGVTIAVALAVTDTPRWWRLGLLIPFWGGALGVLQAAFHT
jgi:hypothetical protein